MKLLYFAWVRQKVGAAEEEVSPPAEVRDVAGLIAWLATRSAGHAAAFADPRQVRGVVLLHGVLLGAAGGLVGLVLGVAGAAVAVPVLERSVAESFGRFDVRLLELLPVVLLGAATGLAAAL